MICPSCGGPFTYPAGAFKSVCDECAAQWTQADGYRGPDVCERCGDPVPYTLSINSPLLRLCENCTEETIGEVMRDSLR